MRAFFMFVLFFLFSCTPGTFSYLTRNLLATVFLQDQPVRIGKRGELFICLRQLEQLTFISTLKKPAPFCLYLVTSLGHVP